MRIINQKLLITMIAAVCSIVFIPYLYAQNTSDSPNTPVSSVSGRSLSEFLTPDGHFDLDAARRAGFQGSLNMKGYTSSIDTATGQPVFRPAASASTAEHPDDIYWDNSMSSSIPGVDDEVNALTVYDGKLIAGGEFDTAGGVSANGIAAWDGSSWSPLGSGMGGGVFNTCIYALTVYEDKLIAGGSFTTAGGVEANSIAAWDGSSWSPLGSGLGGTVIALTVYDGKLIAGGWFFIYAGRLEAIGIAAWNGLSWSPFGSGWDCVVSVLTVYNGKLIAGGWFNTAGGVEANSIAAWDGSSWSPLGSGLGGTVFALTVYDGKLIAGGVFHTAGGVEAAHIAAWDGLSWSPLGSGMSGGIDALTVYDGKLIAGGWFLTAGGVEANSIAAWDGSSWSPLGSGIGGDYPWVYALTMYDENLIAGGWFTTAGGKVAPYIASWTKKDSPHVFSVSPNNVTNEGVVNVTIYGWGFMSGANVKLKKSEYQDIAGFETTVIDSTEIATRFDLTGRQLGNWDVVVTNPDGQIMTLPKGFKIDVGYVNLWVDIVGRDQIRVGREQTYWIRYGNSGNIEAPSAYIFVLFPINISSELAEQNGQSVKFSKSTLPDDYDLNYGGYSAIVRRIKPGTVQNLSLKLRAPSNGSGVFDIQVIITSPWPAEDFITSNSTIRQKNLSKTHEMKELYFIEGQIWTGFENGKYVEHAVIILPEVDSNGNIVPNLEQAWSSYTDSNNKDIGYWENPGALDRHFTKNGWKLVSGHNYLSADEIRNLRKELTDYTKPQNSWIHDDLKWKSFASGNKGNCQGIIEWSAEKAGINSGNGFVDNNFEKNMDKLHKDSYQLWAESWDIDSELLPSNFIERLLEKNAEAAYADRSGHASSLKVQYVTSIDPNAKSGPAGFGISKALPVNELLQYMVYFENVDSATAAAEEVAVLDTLSANLDWSSFAMGDIQIGERTIPVPESSRNFSTSIALNDTTQLQVSSAIDPATGVVRWYFKGTDPRTGDLAGFLPPNKTSPEGEGHVSFTIKPKKDVSSGTRIQNRASIVFDVNPPMQTNEVANTIDALPPSSSVKSVNYFVLPPRLRVSWAGSDDTGGSGLKSYSIFYSEDGGPYTAWLSNTSATSGEFTIQGGNIFRFYSVAQDSVGNVEIQPDSSDVRIDLSVSVEDNSHNIPRKFALSQNYPNPFNPVTTIVYDVPSQSRIILTIYNILGQSVRTLIDDTRQAGSYRVTWDGTDRFGAPVSVGVYFYRLQAGKHSETKKMLLLK